MIDRGRVEALIRKAGAPSGAQVLDDLEEAGYAIVRAGLVPSLDPLTEVEGRLALIGEEGLGHRQAAAAGCATLLEQLRHLACIVLDIDETDVDGQDEDDVDEPST